jgi:nitroimidazol reductase NimA-like FMN-containing flavoprotein (pyridoxamine 5'-phosphate oxidase superfamily)
MFRNLRRDDRSLSPEEARDILQYGEYGVLSVMGTEGYPYGVPVNYVFKNDVLYIHSATEGHKLDSIRENDKVSFVVVGRTQVLPENFSMLYKSTIVFGRAVEIVGSEKQEALMALIDRFSSEFLEKGKKYVEGMQQNTAVLKIDIDHISGKGKKVT